jgi:penicillin amidase
MPGLVFLHAQEETSLAGSRKRNRKGSNSATRVYTTPVQHNGVEDDLPEEGDEIDADTSAAAPPRTGMSRRRKILLGVLVSFLVLIGGVAFWVWLTIQRTLPTLSGTVTFPGLSAPVTVTRDLYGVPHIVAANTKDLIAAQGYVHAQDRLFQMFQLRAAGQGRLAELFSPGFVDADRFLRTVGFRRAAEAELAQLDPKVREWLEDYARGVNEFLHTHGDSLPLEFVLLGIGVEDWTPVDTVAFGKLQAWDLSNTWGDDLVRTDIAAKIGSENIAKLFPPYPGDAPTITGSAPTGHSALVNAYNRQVRPFLPDMDLSEIGSNNWVLSGDKTHTGKPLLANDPHLGVSNPSPWYQVHLTALDGSLDVVGFGFAGTPGIVTGHNRDIAWGVTNTGTDVMDVFIEKLDPAGHPGQYQSGGNWVPLQLITETIKVKGGEAVTQVVRLTNHGPILTDPFLAATVTTTPTMPYGKSITDVVALKWSALEPGKLFEAAYGFQTAKNWEEFRAALSKWDVPGQNFVYADREGNIGYQMTGKVPVRKAGDGLVAIPGWTGEGDWTGWLPYERMPNVYNPPEGYIATANNKPFSDPSLNIPGHWSAPWRISRIEEMIKAREKLDIAYIETMLRDTQSSVAKKWQPVLANLKPSGEREMQAVELFTLWDGNLDSGSNSAALYQFTVARAMSETFADELGEELFVGYATTSRSPIRALELLLDKPDDPLWDRTDTTQKETRDDTLLRALTTATNDMHSAMGDNKDDWEWGKVHRIVPTHPFGSQPIIGGAFNLSPEPIAGDMTTVAVAGFTAYDSGFAVDLHQSYRMIIDLGDWNNSKTILATGQSGQPFARHWGDQYAKWLAFQYNPMLYEPANLQRELGSVLVLQP